MGSIKKTGELVHFLQRTARKSTRQCREKMMGRLRHCASKQTAVGTKFTFGCTELSLSSGLRSFALLLRRLICSLLSYGGYIPLYCDISDV